jgi:heat shock protein HslJ
MRRSLRPDAMPRVSLTALVLVVALAGCGSAGVSPPSASAQPFDAQGAWQLRVGTADGEAIPIVEGHPITLTIEGSEIGGTAACNHYGGRLQVSGGRMSIQGLGMTAMACVDAGVMEAEAAYTAALGRVESISGEGGELLLGGEGVELRFERLPAPPTAEIVDTEWVLDTIFVGDVASSPLGEPATLQLRADGTFEGSTGCRSFDGNWQEQGAQIITPTWGMDGRECPADLADQDSHVVSVIGDGFVPSVEGDLLTLTDPGGIGLVYRAEP